MIKRIGDIQEDKIKKYKYFIVLFVFLSGVLFTQGAFNLVNDRNHPELKWFKYSTKNFNIIYSTGLDSIAVNTGTYAERIYEMHKKNLGLSFNKKYNVFISDMDDIANGATTPYNYFFIWVSPSDYLNHFTGVDTWLKKVIAHEMVHALIFHNTKSWLDLLIPIPSVPLDIHEGMAQFYAGETYGLARGDKTLTMRIRNDKLERDITDLDKGQLPYAKGISKIRWLKNYLDDKDIGKIFKFKNKAGIFNFKKGFERIYKKSYSDFSYDWKKAMNVYYNWREGLSEETQNIGEIIENINCKNISVIKQTLDKRAYVLTGVKDLRSPSRGLYYYDIKKKILKLLASKGIKENFSIKGDQIVFSRTHYGKNQSLLSDIFMVNSLTGRQLQVTSNQRAYEPVFIDDNRIVFLKNDKVAVNFYSYQLKNKKIKKLTDYSDQRQFGDLSYGQTNNKVIASYLSPAEGTYGIFILDLKEGSVKEIKSKTHCRFPQFSPTDQNQIIYTGYEKDVANVYIYDLESGIKKQITNQANFVLITDWISPNKLLGIVQTDISENFPVLLDADRIPQCYEGQIKPKYLNWREKKPTNNFESIDGEINGEFKGRYASVSDIRLINLLPLPYWINNKTTLGVESLWADMLGKHQLMTSFAFDFEDIKNSSYRIIYLNKSTIFNIGMRYSSQDVITFNFINEKSLYERISDFGIKLSYNLNTRKSFSTNSFFFGFDYIDSEVQNLMDFTAEEDVETDPGLMITPESYQESVFNLHYCYKDVKPHLSFPFEGQGLLLNYRFSTSLFGGKYIYNLFRLGFFKMVSLDKISLLLSGDLCWYKGNRPAQNILGINKYSTFDFIFGYSSEEVYVRGGKIYTRGNLLASSSLEIHCPIFQNYVNTVLFLDYALVSKEGFSGIGEAERYGSYGGELQLFINKLLPVMVFGYAKDLYNKSSEWDFYIMLKTTLPF